MSRPSNDGGSAAGQVQVIIAEIEAIARRQLPGAQDEASAATQDFRNLQLDPSSFGEVPIAKSLGVQHGAAHEVFVSTVDTVLQDLNEFASRLTASMQAHQATDEGVQSAMLSFSGGYRDHGSQSERHFEEELGRQGDRLHVEQPEGGADDSAQPASDSPADADATARDSSEQGSDNSFEG